MNMLRGVKVVILGIRDRSNEIRRLGLEHTLLKARQTHHAVQLESDG